MGISKLLVTIALLISVCGSPVGQTSTSGQVQSSRAGNPLADTQWRLASFATGRAQWSASEGTTITLKFGSDGRAGGSSGCNTYGADYRVIENRLTFGSIISTKRACLNQGANQQEQRYFRALASANRFVLANDRLTIFHEGGRSELTFRNDSPSMPAQEVYEDLTNPVALLASFYNAVNGREYDRAYGYWEIPPGRQEDFSRGYQNTANVQLIVQPPTHIDGAAGSLYAEVPTVIVAHQRNGGERIFSGCYVTRKSSVRAAENPSEGGWHIYRASLSPAAANASIPQLLARACRK